MNRQGGYHSTFGANAGNAYYGIDIFAYAFRHELTHTLNYYRWWWQGWIASQDMDRDDIPGWFEVDVGLDPNNTYTHSGIDDDQYYTLSNEPYLQPGTFKREDWAHPGEQYP